jgi:hypothetical protein
MIEYIKAHLGPSKVTLDVKTNKYEEVYDYPEETYEFFNHIENIIDMYNDCISNKKDIQHQTTFKPNILQHKRDQAVAAVARPVAVVASPLENAPPLDSFIYCVLLSLDNTLSLLPDKNVFINKFKSDLIEKINNYATFLKKLSIEKADIVNAIKSRVHEDRGALYKYMSVILNKTIIIQREQGVYVYESNKRKNLDGLWIYETQLNYEELSYLAYKEKYYNSRKIYYLANTISSAEKLNTLLVKELKDIADDLGLETTIIENGKKKNLLKDNLKEIIKKNLFPSI